MTDINMSLVAQNEREHGEAVGMICSHDNSSCAVVTSRKRKTFLHSEPGAMYRYVFKGAVVTEQRSEEYPAPFAMSFDGKRFAVAESRQDKDRFIHAVKINGKIQYTLPCDTIREFAWLDNERLACVAYNGYGNRRSNRRPRNKRRAVGCFVNGKMVRGLDMFSALNDDLRLATIVRQNGQKYTLSDDGTCSDRMPYDPEDPFHEPQGAEPEQPQEIWNDLRNEVYVRYRDSSGPIAFHAIETFDGVRPYAFNGDRSKVAYIGMKYPMVARKIQQATDILLRRCLENSKVNPTSLLVWPLALLINPYFGPLYHAIESSRRYYPVNGSWCWSKGYGLVTHFFLTPENELAVTVRDGRSQRVVIEEREGPSFDQIENVRWLKDQQCVCYMARLGNSIFRVLAY